jgi:hypothetical protein
MIMLIIFVFYGLYFFYLNHWAGSYLYKEYSFGSPSPPKTMAHSPVTSILIGVFWGITITAGVFWGFTYNRYPHYLKVTGINMELFFLIAIGIVISLSYWVMFSLGEMHGVARMKNTDLFLTWEEQQRKK